MKILKNVLLGAIIAIILFLSLSGMIYWGSRLTGSEHKVYVHHGIKACHCGYNNVVDSLTFKNGDMIFHFNGKNGIYQHYATWIDTVTITTFAK